MDDGVDRMPRLMPFELRDVFESRDSRPLTDAETGRLRRLLSADFPGVQALREQAEVVRAIDTAHVGTILFAFSKPVIAGEVVGEHPVSGRYVQRDGSTIELELYLSAGLLHLMGFINHAEPASPISLPEARSIAVWVAENDRSYRLTIPAED